MRTLTGETKYLEREKQQGEKQDLRKKDWDSKTESNSWKTG